MKISQIAQYVGGAAIAAGALFIFFRDVNPAMLAQQIAATSPIAIVGACALTVVTLFFRALRWKVMLPRTPGTHTRELFSTTMIGFMVNNILPARIGEAVRAFFLWKRNGYSLVTAVGSLIAERIIDLFAYSLFFIIPVFTLPQLAHSNAKIFNLSFGNSLKDGAIFLSACWGVAGVCLLLYYIKPSVAKAVVKFFLKFVPGFACKTIRQILVDLVANLDWIFDLKRVGLVVLLTGAVSFCYPPIVMLLVGHKAAIGLLGGMFGQAFASLGAAIPLVPGYIGTLHAALSMGLGLVGVDKDTAKVVAILYHASGYVTVTVLGLIFFFRSKISFKDMSGAANSIKK